MENENILKEFGRRIRGLRKSQNISQEELAVRTGFHRTYIGMVERGERNISLINIKVFADYFEIGIGELFGGKD